MTDVIDHMFDTWQSQFDQLDLFFDSPEFVKYVSRFRLWGRKSKEHLQVDTYYFFDVLLLRVYEIN